MTHDHLCVSLVPLFNHLPIDDQERIEQLMHHQVFQKGDLIFSPDHEAQLALVAKGAMKVYRLTNNGREQLLRIAQPGDYEGDHFLFGVTNDNLFGQALQKTEICLLKRSDFVQLLENYPQLTLTLMSINAEKTHQLEQQTQFLSMEKVEERLAFYLYNLAKASDSHYLELPMKMKELATFLGTSPETLSRKFKVLENKTLIERDLKTIKVLDLEGLEDY
ncbi:Crp/Fnr family transcriptional regulator [Streptococcus halotolerans]|uniref:Crp/Fnr family transcriptional regulator n=1 Tax=Streptococcus halotolerans TaxID=1814128 RepID=UPI00078991F7|nr:Crp/Fnr family transcriptional regulator [Streptococcus halotolerans]